MAEFPDWRPSVQNSERHSFSLLNERLSFAASTDDHAQTDRQTTADITGLILYPDHKPQIQLGVRAHSANSLSKQRPDRR